MPYGHNRQYLDLIAEARKSRLQLARQQEKLIAQMFQEIASELTSELRLHNPKSLTYRWLKDYATSLKKASKELYSAIDNLVQSNTLQAALSGVQPDIDFYSTLSPVLSQRFRDTFSSIPKEIVDELMSGGIYKDFTGLSERIWNYQEEFQRDISRVINQGILGQKSAYDLAKDLEIYLNPAAAKPFDWGIVYPGVNRQIDYNAQRLARTSVTHAYQLSLERAAADNPFVEGFRWLSSHTSRVCPVCADRDGKVYPKGGVPLDHPNGMCVIVSIVSKSYEDIAAELADWVTGGSNPALDRWLLKNRR